MTLESFSDVVDLQVVEHTSWRHRSTLAVRRRYLDAPNLSTVRYELVPSEILSLKASDLTL